MKSLKIRFAEIFIGEIDDSLKRGFWLVSELINKHKCFLLLLLAFGIIVGFVEGAAIGLIAYSAIVVTGSATECPELLEKIISYTPLGMCQDYDKYKVFVYLVYASIAMQIIKSIAIYVSGYLGIILKTRVIYDVKRKVINKMMNLDYQAGAKVPAGEKQLIFSNSLSLSSLVILFNKIIVILCVLSAYAAILITMDWKLSIFAGLLIIFLLFIVSPVLEKVRRVSFQLRRNSKHMHKKMIDYMFAMRLIKVFGRNKEITEELELITRKEAGFLRLNARYVLILEPLQETIVILSVGAMLLYSFYSAGSSIEQFLPATLAYVLVLHKCNTRVAALNTVRASFAKSMAGVQYVSDFLITKQDFNSKGKKLINKDWKEIQFNKVSFQYDESESAVINDLNLDVKRGSTVAFVGGSGAGKSTLVDVLIGLLRPSGGEVSIGGVNSVDASMDSWLSQISMVSQNDLILNGTIRENLLFSNSNASDSDIKKACEVAQANEFIEKLDEGYDSNLGEMGGRLSGGQLQRIAFARAILKDAPILILDEATSALDVVIEKKIVDSLDSILKDRTIVMIAHRLSTVMNADQIYVLDSGRIIDSGSHEELIERPGKYQNMWLSSSKK